MAPIDKAEGMGLEPLDYAALTYCSQCNCENCCRCRAAHALPVEHSDCDDIPSHERALERLIGAWGRLDNHAQDLIWEIVERSSGGSTPSA